MRRRTALAALTAFALIPGLMALVPTAANADTALTLTPTADSVVNAASPTTNIGGSLSRMDATPATERQVYIKFAVAGVPAGDAVESATLRLVNTDTSTGTVTVSNTASTWAENTINWSNKPVAGSQVTSGTLAAGSGVASTFDVTSAVKGNGDVSLVLKTTDAGIRTIGSRENATVALRPQLVIQTKTPPPPVAWGSSVETRGQTPRNAMLREESTMGKGAIRVYGQAPSFPTMYDPLDDRTLVYSFKGANPAQVLSGAIDAQFRQFLTDAKAYVGDPANPTAKVIWSYYHEPEDNIAAGNFTAADYRAAWGRLINISNEPAFVNEPDIKSSLILMKYSLQTGSGRVFEDYYNPGVDILGFDTYKWDTATSVASMIDPIVSLAAAKGKPWAIAETGVSVKHTDAQRQTALHDLAAYAATRPQLPAYVTYFNSDPGGPSEWNWPIDDEPVMANAWKSGQDGV